MKNKVKLSSTFFNRCACKYCGGKPKEYWFNRNRHLDIDIKMTIDNHKHIFITIDKFNSDWYLDYSPRQFTRLGYLRFRSNLSKFNPKIHNSFIGRQKRIDRQNNNYSEYLSCLCGRTNWSFVNKVLAIRPDLLNRKAKSTYDKPISFL
jgi:hypothetical protein